MRLPHPETHLLGRTGWLRAAVLGANDGIISTASLVLGVLAASGLRRDALVAGIAGLVAGAMSMAAGEYVSVSSQSDTESAAIAKERAELAESPNSEIAELAGIYVSRGLEPGLAREVAVQLMAHDALAAHARDELGLSELTAANPIQAAITSAVTFAVGAAAPLILAVVIPKPFLSAGIALGTLIFLASLGAIGGRAGGAPMLRPALRVAFWGALAMVSTTLIGQLFGATV
ncbi:MAG: VIT family protein [Rhodospirillales bacterium]|nr:VIT family protein [Rhodospirillales bacterium]